MAKEIYTVLALVLDFRLLVQSYLIDRSSANRTDSDDEMQEDSFDKVGVLCVTAPDFYSKFTQCET